MTDEQRSICSLYSLKKISIFCSAKNVVDRGTLNSFTLLKDKTYSTYRNNKITKIETFRIEIDGFEFIVHILIYLEEGDIIDIERRESLSRFIELKIHNQDEFSSTSIEEDYELKRVFE